MEEGLLRLAGALVSSSSSITMGSLLIAVCFFAGVVPLLAVPSENTSGSALAPPIVLLDFVFAFTATPSVPPPRSVDNCDERRRGAPEEEDEEDVLEAELGCSLYSVSTDWLAWRAGCWPCFACGSGSALMGTFSEGKAGINERNVSREESNAESCKSPMLATKTETVGHTRGIRQKRKRAPKNQQHVENSGEDKERAVRSVTDAASERGVDEIGPSALFAHAMKESQALRE